jgi:hypothetical protein
MGTYCRRLAAHDLQASKRKPANGFKGGYLELLVKAQSALCRRIVYMEQIGIAVAGAVLDLSMGGNGHSVACRPFQRDAINF